MFETDKYLEICETAINSFVMRCNAKEEEINLQTNTTAITEGNLALFGHILWDLHELYEVPMTYNEFSQYDIFPKIEDVVSFFYNNIQTGVR